MELDKGMKCWERKLEQSDKKRKAATSRAIKADADLLKIQREMDKAQARVKDLEEIESSVGSIFSPKQVAYLLKCYQKDGKGRVVWEKEDLASALTLLSMSPKIYEFLRRKRGLPLPSPPTVRRYMAQFPVEPGVQYSVFEGLKTLGAKKTLQEKTVVLAYDEMMLRIRIEYDVGRDKIIGPHKYVQVNDFIFSLPFKYNTTEFKQIAV